MANKPFLFLDINYKLDDRLMLSEVLESEKFELIGISANNRHYSSNDVADRLLEDFFDYGISMPIAKTNELNIKDQKIITTKLENNDKKNKDYIEEDEAIDYIYKAAKDCEVMDIITTGPLTTIAGAIEKYEDFTDYINHIFILGGAFLKGDVTNDAEINIYNDPLAADIVFRSNIDVFLLPIDLSNTIILKDEIIANHKENSLIREYMRLPEDQRYISAALLFYMYLTPEAFIFEEMGLKVDTKYQRGKLKEDNDRKKNLVANKVNIDSFYEFVESLIY